MSLHEKLRHHLAGKDVSLADEDALVVASWQDEGARMLVACPGALTADAVIDAHVRAQAARATLTLASEGAPTPVARRMAQRYGIALLDLAAVVVPEPAAPAPPVAEPVLALPAPEPTLALPAFEPPVEAPILLAPPAEAAPLVAPTLSPAGAPTQAPADAPAHAPADPPVVVAASLPEPALAHGELRLPWDPSVAIEEPTPMHVEPMELLAMPWAHEGEHVEVIESGRTTRHAPERPTVNPGWGLPWPRPVPSMDGVAIADPRVWQAPERIMAVRQDLDRIGAPSFGVAKPEGSQWLKRLSEFPERP